MGNLDWKVAIEQLKDAVTHLKSTGSPKVGSIGIN